MQFSRYQNITCKLAQAILLLCSQVAHSNNSKRIDLLSCPKPLRRLVWDFLISFKLYQLGKQWTHLSTVLHRACTCCFEYWRARTTGHHFRFLQCQQLIASNPSFNTLGMHPISHACYAWHACMATIMACMHYFVLWAKQPGLSNSGLLRICLPRCLLRSCKLQSCLHLFKLSVQKSCSKPHYCKCLLCLLYSVLS